MNWIEICSPKNKTILQWITKIQESAKQPSGQIKTPKKDVPSLQEIVMSEFGFAADELFDEFIQQTFTWIRIRDPENRAIHQGNKTGDPRPEIQESTNGTPDTEITDKKMKVSNREASTSGHQ